jgi:hypothetical protein
MGYLSLHTAAMFAVLGASLGGVAFGVGWLLGIFACWIFWQTRTRRVLHEGSPRQRLQRDADCAQSVHIEDARTLIRKMRM